MGRRVSALAIGLLALGSFAVSGSAGAEGFRGVAFHGKPGGFGQSLHHGPRRGWIPALQGGSGTRVTVVVQQVFVPPPQPRLVSSLPSVLDLPVEVGIREAKPDRPAFYVLNEASAAPVRRLASGARIIELDEPVTTGSTEAPAFGAKIIHLSVPVGR